MKLQNRAIALLITLLICMGMFTVNALASNAIVVTGEMEPFREAISKGGNIKLSSDILAITETIEITNEVSLDLNGHTLDYDGEGTFIKVNGGILNLSDSAEGGTIKGSDNATTPLIHLDNAVMNFDGGIITGHVMTANRGAGIYADNYSTLNMTGGEVSHCKATADIKYQGRGGGIAIKNSSNFNFSGGKVTHNFAEKQAGGIHIAGGCTFIMTGGEVSYNKVSQNEGGGIYIDAGTDKNVIKGGSICYNETTGTNDWGGGGIFIREGGTLTLSNAYVTDNYAGGFGAGITACPTGNVIACMVDGVAIVDNKAEGAQLAVNSSKPQDRIALEAKNEGKFSSFNDFYSAHASSVTSYMLGGGSANWSGSWVDGTSISLVNDGLSCDSVASMEQLGLNSNPSSADKQKALDSAKVIISGNRSKTHGGGVLCNGELILGSEIESTNYMNLTLSGKKTVSWSDATAEGTPEMGEYYFEFYDEDERFIYIAKNNEKGDFYIPLSAEDLALSLSAAESEGAKRVFYLREVIGDDSRITYDETLYRVSMTVKLTEKVDKIGNNVITTKIVFADDLTWSYKTAESNEFVPFEGTVPTFNNKAEAPQKPIREPLDDIIEAPKTGDSRSLVGFVAVLSISSVSLLAVLILNKKKKD